jgi:SAM-dependent methyltransferase
MSESFDADWLALREPHDAAARSIGLAERLSHRLPARPRLLDLGAGTGSLFRWLAPVIARSQAWVFADADPGLLGHALDETAYWAEDQGWTVTSPGRALLIHAPTGTWRIETRRVDLAGPLDLSLVDAVTCSALLDLVSEAWIAALVARLRVPLLACLSVDGRDRLAPAHPLDGVILGAFRRDQARDKGFGPALGPRAPSVLARLLAQAGFDVQSESTDWHIRPDAPELQTALIDAYAAVARHWLKPKSEAIDDWQDLRGFQCDRARLHIHIGHRDCLAFPPTL